MRIAIKIALWTLASLVVLTCAALLYLRSADLSVYEDRIEGALSKAVGHKVDVDGLFELRIGRLTTLVAEGIRITNADWQGGTQLASGGHLSITVNTWSLFSAPIIVDNLVARDIRIQVARDENRASNWDSIERQEKTQDAADSEPLNLHLIAFREVRVDNFTLVFNEPSRERPFELTLEHLAINPDSSDVLDLDLRGDINDYDLWADGNIGPWRNLISGKDLAADLDLTLGRVKLSIEGSVADLQALEEVNIDLSLQGPAIERVTNIFGLPPFASGEFLIEADSHRIDDRNRIHVDGDLGDISLTANGLVDQLLRPAEMQLDFNFTGPDSQHVAAVFGFEGAPQVPFRLAGDVQVSGRRFEFSGTSAKLGDNSVAIEGWLDLSKTIPDGDVSIDASGPDLSVFDPFLALEGIPRWDFGVTGRLQKSGRRVNFENVLARLGPNRLSANGVVDPDGANSEVFLSVAGPDISFIQGLANLPDVPAKPFSASAYLRPDPIGINLDEAQIKVGDNEVAIDGVIGTLDGADGTSITVHGFGPELHNVSLLTGIPYLPHGKYDYRTKISIDRDVLNIDHLDLTVVGASASASGQLNIGQDAGDFDLRIAANSDDVSELELFDSLSELHGDRLRLNGELGNDGGILTLAGVTADIGNLGMSVNGTFDSTNLHATLDITADAPDTEVLDRFLRQQSFPDGPLSVSVSLERNDHEVEFSNATVRIGEIHAEIDGVLSNAPLENSSDLKFHIAGPDLNEFLQTLGVDAAPPKTFEFAGEINGTPTGFAIENIDAAIGENDIVGRVTADLRGKPSVTGTISAKYIDLARRLALMKEAPAPATPSGPYVIPDEPLPLGWLQAFDANIDLRADRLLLTQLDVHDFLLGVHIENGALRADPISLGEMTGEISGHIHLTPSDDAYTLDAEINVENIHVGLLDSSGHTRADLPPMNGQIRLTGTGKSAHEIMAGANGRIALTQGAGRIVNTLGGKFFGDLITEIVNTLNPLRQSSKYTNVECAFFVTDIEKGVATLTNVVMQTDRITLGAEGTVNFADEKLRISASAAPRKGIGVSVGSIANSFLNVRGTLKSPSLGIDPTGSVTTTGAAVATGGLSLLAKGLWDRLQAERSICEALPEAHR